MSLAVTDLAAKLAATYSASDKWSSSQRDLDDVIIWEVTIDNFVKN